MHIRAVFALAALALPIAAQGVTVNFHDAFPDSFGNPATVFVGQGAYYDPGHNTWNAFGSTGTTLNSDGTTSPVTVAVTYGFTNGGVNPANQGLPQLLLGNGLGVNGAAALGTFTISSVPAGSYDLYLYGTNFDHNRGTSFTVSSGSAHGGVSATLNNTINRYVHGVNFVVFHGVTPNANGTISGTWAPNPADGVGNPNLPGEGNFNGFQLVGNPDPIGACCIASNGTCSTVNAAGCTAAGGAFQSAGSVCATAACPVGACCNGCAGCVLLGPSACTGAYGGNGSTCGTAGCTIVNGGFEFGDFTGWTQFGDTSYTTVFAGQGDDGFSMPHGGTFAAEFGPAPPDGGGIQQTIPASAGQSVTIGFWFRVPGGAPNFLSVVFDGQTLLSLTDDTAHPNWTQFTFTATATTNNPTLRFTFYNVPSWSNLDDVTVCIAPAGAGVCCRGATCATGVAQAQCTAAAPVGAQFIAAAPACNAAGVRNTPCCYADFNKANGVMVSDIFDYLVAWFAHSPYATVGGNGVTQPTVQDIFTFLTAWFAGGC